MFRVIDFQSVQTGTNHVKYNQNPDLIVVNLFSETNENSTIFRLYFKIYFPFENVNI